MATSVRRVIVGMASLALGPLGFVLESQARNSIVRFVRETHEAKQFIEFIRDGSTLDAQWRTTHMGAAPSAHNWAPDNGDSWTFNDETTLRHVMNDVLAVVTTTGLAWLQKYSRQPLLVPDAIKQALASEPTALAAAFAHDVGVGFEDTKGLVALGQFLLGARKQRGNNDGDWQLLVGAAAYYGEFLGRHFNGSWVWDDVYRSPVVKAFRNNSGVGGASLNVLGIVCTFWVYEDAERYFLNGYRNYERVQMLSFPQ